MYDSSEGSNETVHRRIWAFVVLPKFYSLNLTGLFK